MSEQKDKDYELIAEALEKSFEQLKESHEKMSIKKHEYHQKYMNLKQKLVELKNHPDSNISSLVREILKEDSI